MKKYPKAFETWWNKSIWTNRRCYEQWQIGEVKHLCYKAWLAGKRHKALDKKPPPSSPYKIYYRDPLPNRSR